MFKLRNPNLDSPCGESFLLRAMRAPINYKSVLLSLLLSLLALAATSQTKSSKATEIFPMSAGTFWIYRGIVRWSPRADHVSESKVEWKMEVQRTIRRGEYTGAIVRGLPGDLDGSDGHANPTDALLVRFAQEKVYWIAGERLESSIQLLLNPNEPLQGLLSEGDIFLRMPMVQGDRYCNAENMARTDGHYCWFVESSESIDLAELTRGAMRERATSYRIRYITNPDDVAYDFVPGVGIVGYQHHHHGTVADTELRLAEFHRPSP